jgi:hypothetical protein
LAYQLLELNRPTFSVRINLKRAVFSIVESETGLRLIRHPLIKVLFLSDFRLITAYNTLDVIFMFYKN